MRIREELFVKPSPHITPYCYFVMRVEPYTACAFSCKYCYGRWYLPAKSVKPKRKIIGAFGGVVEEISRSGLLPYPFRLATLVDPFQPLEKREKVSFRILKIALREGYPMIVNTKSSLVVEEPWIDVLKALSRAGLVVLQLSVVCREYCSLLEPNAPSFEERVEIAKTLAKEGVPVVVRYQPLIPGLNDQPDYADEFFSDLRQASITHVVVEYLRALEGEIKVYEQMARDKSPYKLKWEMYGKGEQTILKPPRNYRFEKIKALKEIAEKRGIRLANCKESFPELNDVPDCCGAYLMKREHVKKPTIRELRDLANLNDIKEALAKISEKGMFITTLNYAQYPYIVRKAVRWHEKVLINMFQQLSLPQ